ncbi:TPA: ImmA/IrrE family metallo-endopeptidase [Vibrio parahaemolyticus]
MLNPSVEASQVLRDFWSLPFPVDPVTIGRKLGVQIFDASLPNSVSGALIKAPGRDPYIILEETDSPTRKRFSCAHELGHYISRLKSNDDSDTYEFVDFRDGRSSSGEDPEEVFANSFAANLLMPVDEFKKECCENNNIFHIASYFGVSPEAVKYRMKALGVYGHVR